MASIHMIASSFPRHQHDLAGRFVYHQALHLASKGDDVTLFVWHDDASFPLGPPLALHNNIRVIRVHYMPKRAWQSLFFGPGVPETSAQSPSRLLLTIPAVASMLNALLRLPPPDIYVGHWFVPGGLIARLAGRFRHRPSFVIGHSGGVQLLHRVMRYFPTLIRDPLWAAFLGPHNSPPITSLASSSLIQLLPLPLRDRCLLAPMGFAGPPPIISTPKIIQRSPHALFLGRLVPIKAPEIAIQAAIALGIPIDVVGDGPLLNPLKHRFSSPSVVFHGPLYGPQKRDVLKRATLSFHPSCPQSGRHEGLPVSLLECASQQILPFVSGVPGISPWLADPSLQIVQHGFPHDLVSKVQHYLHDLSLGSRSQFRSLSLHQAQRVASLYWPTYIDFWRLSFQRVLDAHSARFPP